MENKNRKFRLMKDLPDEIVFRRYKGTRYYVSEDGRVYSSQTNMFLKGYRGGDYLWFDLWDGREKTRKSQHRLIAECFIPNPKNLPIVRHLNDNPYDIRLSNLAWGTKSDNMNDAVKNGLLKDRPSPKGEKHSKAKLTAMAILSIRKEIDSGVHYKDVAEKYKITGSYAYKIGARQCWTHLN